MKVKTLQKALAAYRIGKLQILSDEYKHLDENDIIKHYYSFLVVGVNYLAALKDEEKHIEVTSTIKEMQAIIEKCPIKLNQPDSDTGFLKDNDDFGKMEREVVS
jgi:hypothetical protein